MTELRKQLEWMANLGKDISNAGLGERFVLKHGHEFGSAVELPRHIARGQQNRCFGNAALVAIMFPDEFIYTEGYMLPKEGVPLVFEHGWLTNRMGQVVDPTLSTEFRADYFGVLFKHKYVLPRAGLSLINNRRDLKLVMSESPQKHIVQLEKWIKVPASELESGSSNISTVK